MKQLKLTRHLAWREIGGQAYIINTQDSVLHELDETGSFIWKAVAAANDYDTVLKKLIAAYDVSPETARADLDEFLATLADKGLLEIRR